MEKNIIEFEFDPETILDLPSNIKYHKIRNKHLIIAPEIPSWLALNNTEKEIFNCFLQKRTISQVLNMKFNSEDVINVLATIKFKKFISTTKSNIRKNLYSATLYLTNNCNLRCIHCYMYSGFKEDLEIEYYDWYKVIDTLKDNGVKIVTLTGGEPMMKKGFFKILNYLNKQKISVILITNGTLITQKNYQKISENCNEIQISLDGPTQKLHEIIRGKGTFKKTLRAIELLAKTNITLFIAMTPIPQTIDEFELYFPYFIKSSDFLRKKNVYLNITAELQTGRNIEEVNRFKGNNVFYKKVKKIVDTYIDKNRLEKREMLALVPGERKINCGFGESYTVLWDGTIKRCLKDQRKIQILNIDSKTNLKQIFQKSYNKTAVNYLSNCKNCDLRFICGGSCRIENQKNNGNFNIGGCNLSYKQHLYELLLKFDKLQFEVV